MKNISKHLSFPVLTRKVEKSSDRFLSIPETKQAEHELPLAMVVEDDPVIQMIIKHVIQKKFNVMACMTGMEALSSLYAGTLPDIIITDLHLPELGGLELISQLKNSGYFKGIPIMVLSAEDSTMTRIQCLDAGADDYIVKPFNPKELEARMKAILRTSAKLAAA
jgi:DNA-binding response OmpR family regulator